MLRDEDGHRASFEAVSTLSLELERLDARGFSELVGAEGASRESCSSAWATPSRRNIVRKTSGSFSMSISDSRTPAAREAASREARRAAMKDEIGIATSSERSISAGQYCSVLTMVARLLLRVCRYHRLAQPICSDM